MYTLSNDAAVLVAELFRPQPISRYRSEPKLLHAAVQDADGLKHALDALLLVLVEALTKPVVPSVARYHSVRDCIDDIKLAWRGSPLRRNLLKLVKQVVQDVETHRDAACNEYQGIFDTRYREFRDALKQVSKDDTAPADASQLMSSPSFSGSSITTSTSSAKSTSTSDLDSFFSTSTSDTSLVTASSSSGPSINHSDLTGPAIADLTDPTAVTATVAAAPIVVAASLTFTLAPGSAPTPNPAPAPAPASGLAPAPAPAPVPTPTPTPTAIPVSFVAPVVSAATAGPQLFSYGDAQIRLPIETLELVLDSFDELSDILVIAASTHGLRAAASHKIRTRHLREATLDARTWIRAANVAYPRSWKTVRGYGMSLTIDLEGEMSANVRLEAQYEVQRLLQFIEVLKFSSRHCSLLPTLFNSPAPLLRLLDLGSGTMPLVPTPGPFFDGSAAELITLAASSTALRAAVACSSFEAATPALKKVRVYPDAVGAVRTAALQDAIRWHSLDMVDVRGAPDSTGTVDFGNRFKTGVLKLSMRSLAAFCDMALRVTMESMPGVTDHLVLVGAGADSRAVIAALSFLDYGAEAIVFCGILAIGDMFQLTLRSESGRSCSVTSLSESDLVGLVDHLGVSYDDILRGLRTAVIPWRASVSVLAAIIRVLASAPPAVNVVAVASPHLPLDAADQVSLAHPALAGLIRGCLKVVGCRFQQRHNTNDTEGQRFDCEGAQMPEGNGKDVAATIAWPEFMVAVKAWTPFGNEVCVSGVRFEDAPFGQLYTDSGVRIIMEKTPWTV